MCVLNLGVGYRLSISLLDLWLRGCLDSRCWLLLVQNKNGYRDVTLQLRRIGYNKPTDWQGRRRSLRVSALLHQDIASRSAFLPKFMPFLLGLLGGQFQGKSPCCNATKRHERFAPFCGFSVRTWCCFPRTCPLWACFFRVVRLHTPLSTSSLLILTRNTQIYKANTSSRFTTALKAIFFKPHLI